MRTRRKQIVLTAIATAAVVVAAAPSASASGHSGARHSSGWSRTLTTQVALPFGIAVDRNHNVYVADGGTNTVSRVRADGSLAKLAEGLPGGEVAGIAVADDGSWAYTTSQGGFVHTAAEVVVKRPGKPDVVADVLGYEQAHNPDQVNHYGLPAGNDCAQGRAWLDQLTGGGASYTGLVDSHPYAVTSLGNGSWAVADAGANAILKVDAKGNVSTIAVLPPQQLTVTPQLLASASVDENGNPVPVPDYASCLVGKTYGFEPVPTDVEIGPFGQLVVSTLPGGPEDPSLGARGSVYWVGRSGGWTYRFATGFSGATNLAVAKDGTTYVTEFFAGKVTKLGWFGQRSTFATLDGALADEADGPWLYVATAVFGPTGPTGSIQKIHR